INVAAQTANETKAQYVQIAVPLHLRKLLTYRLPPAMEQAARIGARVMVLLGNKPTAGYIVALLTRLRAGTSLNEAEIKDVQELLDADPPLTPEVLGLARWVADYYAAPLGEVLRASLPAGMNASVEQTISITDKGQQLRAQAGAADSEIRQRALKLLAEEGESEVNAFASRLGFARLPKWLRELEHDGIVKRSYRTRNLPTRAKRRKAVRLIRSITEQDARVSAAQLRAVELLRASQNEMAIGDLVKAAGVSESVVR